MPCSRRAICSCTAGRIFQRSTRTGSRKSAAVAVKTAKAWAIKEQIRDLWSGKLSSEEVSAFFQKWYWWATHSRLKHMISAARTLKRHLGGILAAVRNRISNAVTEGLNNKIESIKRAACGFKNKVMPSETPSSSIARSLTSCRLCREQTVILLPWAFRESTHEIPGSAKNFSIVIVLSFSPKSDLPCFLCRRFRRQGVPTDSVIMMIT